MTNLQTWGTRGWAAAVSGLLVLSTACTAGGPTKAEVDALKQQVAAKDAEIAAVQQKLADAQKAPAGAPAGAPAAGGAPAGGAPAAGAPGADGLTPIFGVRTVPPAQAAPAPTLPVAVPEGLPASYGQPVGPYAMYVEVVASAGPSKYGLLASLGCVQESVFKRGMKAVFRMELYDMTTGKRVTPLDGAIVKVKLGTGDEIPLDFGRRGAPGPNAAPDAPWQWVSAWHIPTDYPVGSVDYSVEITTKDGKTTTLKPPSLKDNTQLRVIA